MAATVTIEVEPTSSVQVTSNEIVQAKLPSGDEVQVEMVGNMRVVNLNRAKSVLKKELFAWLESSDMRTKFGMTTVQVTFTKCGRFATVVARAKPGAFGLRLAALDPHHQLCTYLLGVSFSLESALLHSAARIKQIEDDMDRIDATFKHGDVIMVDHAGYSHVAIYDAVEEVFYELVGDIDSGKDALYAQANSAHTAAMELHEKVKDATQNHLKAALELFRRPETLIRTLTATATVTPAASMESSSSSNSVPSVTLSDVNSTSSSVTNISTDIGKSNDSVTVTASVSVAVDSTSSCGSPVSPPPVFEVIDMANNEPLQQISDEHLPNTSSRNFARHRHSRSADRTHKSVPQDATDISKSADVLRGDSHLEANQLSPEYHGSDLGASSGSQNDLLGSSLRQRNLTLHNSGQSVSSESSYGSWSPRNKKNMERARILANSGHILSITDAEMMPYHEEYEAYDVPTNLQNATRHLRQLAESTDDIDLSKLLDEENASSVFTSAGSDASIQPDDMCPAMAFGFPSHSIAEVMATPKDLFLTREPLLHKRVQYYANALPPDVVVARAKSALGSPGWNPITRNCEHFATWAKTGKTVSTQVFEISSNTAIFGASTLQTIITLSFLGLLSLWIVGRFVAGNSILETMENVFSWLLKIGVLVFSLIFAFAIFVHYQNGSSANFDEWIITKQETTMTTTTTTTTTTTVVEDAPQN